MFCTLNFPHNLEEIMNEEEQEKQFFSCNENNPQEIESEKDAQKKDVETNQVPKASKIKQPKPLN